jgi:hypothetical protein
VFERITGGTLTINIPFIPSGSRERPGVEVAGVHLIYRLGLSTTDTNEVTVFGVPLADVGGKDLIKISFEFCYGLGFFQTKTS